MAVPPSYSDLGKAAKDIFSKGYGEYSSSPKSELLTSRNSRVTEPFSRKSTEIFVQVTSLKLSELAELTVQSLMASNGETHIAINVS